MPGLVSGWVGAGGVEEQDRSWGRQSPIVTGVQGEPEVIAGRA
jgi:hypothetical protein